MVRKAKNTKEISQILFLRRLKIMKKLLALIMVCLMAGSCVACKNKDDADVKSDDVAASSAENAVESNADSSLDSNAGSSDGAEA